MYMYICVFVFCSFLQTRRRMAKNTDGVEWEADEAQTRTEIP